LIFLVSIHESNVRHLPKFTLVCFDSILRLVGLLVGL
jgi:hypothetical protein